MDVVELDPQVEIIGGTADLDLSRGIEFNDVSFSYGDNKVLSSVSFAIDKGEFVGLVGATGSGKSTILKLLLGFYKPLSGEIRIGGETAEHLGSKKVRDHVAFVGQDVFLFDGTLRENISYGSGKISDQRISEVLKIARLDDFVSGLKNGLQTEIGERGVKLSGGQRQRVSIARAILKDAPILILDEATSAVDNETERYIKAAIEDLAKDKTVISVAHRLSTIRNADKIFVFESGKLAATGDHKHLLEEEGTYKMLWDIQVGD